MFASNQIDQRQDANYLLHKIFMEDFYIRENPDIAIAGMSPLLHYLEFGWREGRSPSPYFNSAWYTSRYEDVAAKNIDPLMHFIQQGLYEGRQPHQLIDLVYYLKQYPDLVAADINPYLHFIQFGDREGRSAHPLYSPAFYCADGFDIGDFPPFAHYSEIGRRQGRSPCPAFDLRHYISHYPAEADDPIRYYLLSHPAERPHVHPLIDGNYLIQTAHKSACGMSPLVDYMLYRSHLPGADMARGAAFIPFAARAVVGARFNDAGSTGIANLPIDTFCPKYCEDNATDIREAALNLLPKQEQEVTDQLECGEFKNIVDVDDKEMLRERIFQAGSSLAFEIDVVAQAPDGSALLKARAQLDSLELYIKSWEVADWSRSPAACVSAGKARFILFIDPKYNVPKYDWLAYLSAKVEHDNVAFAGINIYGLPKRILSAGLIPSPAELVGTPPASANIKTGDLCRDSNINTVGAAFTIIARSRLGRIGGFSTDFVTCEGAVRDASYRFTLAGLVNKGIEISSFAKEATQRRPSLPMEIDRQLFLDAHGLQMS